MLKCQPLLSFPAFSFLNHRKMYFSCKSSLLRFTAIAFLSSLVRRAVSQAILDDTFFGNGVLDPDPASNLFVDESVDTTGDFFLTDNLQPTDDFLADGISSSSTTSSSSSSSSSSPPPLFFTDNLLTDNYDNNGNKLLLTNAQSCASTNPSRKIKSRQIDTSSSSTSCPDPQAGTGAGTGSGASSGWGGFGADFDLDSIDFGTTEEDERVRTKAQVKNYWCSEVVGEGIIPVCASDPNTPISVFYWELQCMRSSYFLPPFFSHSLSASYKVNYYSTTCSTTQRLNIQTKRASSVFLIN